MVAIPDRNRFDVRVAGEVGKNTDDIRRIQAARDDVTKSSGWISSGDWTRVSDFVFTTPGDQTYYFYSGTKVHFFLVLAGLNGYGVVQSRSYNSGTDLTTVTLITNTDYLMSESPVISEFSHIENPTGWPDWFNYAPTYDASGAMTFTGVAQDFAKYKVSAQTVTVIVRATGTTGGVAGTQVRATLPTNALLSALGPPGFGNLVNAAAEISLCTIVAGPPDKLAFIRSGAAVWGLGAGRIINGQANYQMA